MGNDESDPQANVGDEIVTICERGLRFHADKHCIQLREETVRKLVETIRAVREDYRDSPDIKL
jgi:hypothetical protein